MCAYGVERKSVQFRCCPAALLPPAPHCASGYPAGGESRFHSSPDRSCITPTPPPPRRHPASAGPVARGRHVKHSLGPDTAAVLPEAAIVSGEVERWLHRRPVRRDALADHEAGAGRVPHIPVEVRAVKRRVLMMELVPTNELPLLHPAVRVDQHQPPLVLADGDHHERLARGRVHPMLPHLPCLLLALPQHVPRVRHHVRDRHRRRPFAFHSIHQSTACGRHRASVRPTRVRMGRHFRGAIAA